MATDTETRTPEDLRREADEIDARVEALREETRSLNARAAVLRRDARALEETIAEPLAALNGSRELAERIVALMRVLGPTTAVALGEELAQSPARIRTVLERLGDAGLVIRTGHTRGTRYRLAEEGEAAEPNREPEYVVRDVGARLGAFPGTFTVAELHKETGLSLATCHRWAKEWASRGVFEVERIGKADVYAYNDTPQGEDPTHAPRSAPKPWEAPERLENAGPIVSKGRRFARREVGEVVSACMAQGAEVREAKHGYAITYNGELRSVPKTPSDHRSLNNAKSKLRSIGLRV